MQERHSQNIPVEKQEQAPQRLSWQQDTSQQQVTQETLDRFNKICLDATQLMNDYKNQSMALKYQIADMVSLYQNKTTGQQAVPVEKIISITNQYEYGMRQANQEYSQLSEELKKEEKQRDQMMLQIQDCFAKLERMEVKIKQKKKRQLQQKQKTQSEKKQTKKQEQPKGESTNTVEQTQKTQTVKVQEKKQ